MNADDDLGAIFGNPKEDSSEDEEEVEAAAPSVKIVPVTTAQAKTKPAAAFDTPEPSSPKGGVHQLRKRGKSVSPKRKLQFGSDSEEEKKAEDAAPKPKRIAKRKRRGTSLPTAPVLTVTAPSSEDDDAGAGETPRRSPRKPPPTRRFDPAKAAKKTRGRLAAKREEEDEEEEEEDERRSRKKQKQAKAKPKKGKKADTKKKKSGKAKKESDEEEAEADSDEKDEDFGDRGVQTKKRKTSGNAKSPKKRSPKKVKADENAINTKVEQEVEALSEYFADIDDTPLEEEEPPGTKWVSMPTLKSPQRLERLSKYPTIAKDYDEYKKALTEAQVSPAPITEFVKDLEDKRLEAVIQP
ncbi:uncharacterized protein ACA1_235940 [Acanthamoeba castellanii str. Neff]|uniref:Uncharacterized protein n=1 Tax=Acanthamoeba castellanii (strain ATCC 30010 / Neff) TaxID=1257118 RepID=L8H3P6_ACACF|nr:uncharacterized protein ACA1_235940 [Acanthamoeba castellanii str. Neff]ELR19046.1 hypothetical protein ACA1_235940 [Acanthamoeba castellanii str. Neff]